MNYHINKANARTHNTDPTLTDQAAARDTDINVIVAQYTVHGQVPANNAEPMYHDFTDLPMDLRGFIEISRELDALQEKLPPQLHGMTIDALTHLTTDQLTDIFTPKPAKPAEPEKETK